MTQFVPWNSQPLNKWAEAYAEGKFIDLAGHRTHYLEAGSGEPVILIHGFNMDNQTWTKNFEQLAAHFKVFAPDLWGLGYSTRQPLDYGYELFVEQIRLFMEALDIQKASLVGHSMGAGTAILFSLKHSDKVDKLVLLGSTGIPAKLPARSRAFKLKGVAELLTSLPTDRIRRSNLRDYWIHDGESLTHEYYQKFVHCQKIEGSTEALLTILRKDFFHTLEYEIQELGQLDIPTLIVWGREDKTIPLSSAKKIHHLIPGSRLEILDDAGHLANFDRPKDFNELVIAFLLE